MAVEAVAGGRYNSNSLSITGRPGGSATTWMSYQNTAGNGRGNSTARCSGGGGGAGGSGYAGDVSGDNRTKGGDGISSFNGFTTGETANFLFDVGLGTDSNGTRMDMLEAAPAIGYIASGATAAAITFIDVNFHQREEVGWRAWNTVVTDHMQCLRLNIRVLEALEL